MVTTTVFKSNTTQAVRLPRAVAFPEDVREVEVIALGEVRVIAPVGHHWDFFFNSDITVADDFMTRRDQPVPQERDRW